MESWMREVCGDHRRHPAGDTGWGSRRERRVIPLYDVISHLVYATRADDVTTVTVTSSPLILLDPSTIRTNARRIAREIAAALLPRGE
jgi:hypothetical protein